MKFSVSGDKQIIKALNQLSASQYEAIVKINMTEIYNRGKRPGGTPVRTGELRQSLNLSRGKNGYAKEYAPDVEYGHRTTGGGYVDGRHYLKNNVDKQWPQLVSDIQKEVKRVV